MIRDPLYFGGILININILISRYNIHNKDGTLAGSWRNAYQLLLLALLEESPAFGVNVVITGMW